VLQEIEEEDAAWELSKKQKEKKEAPIEEIPSSPSSTKGVAHEESSKPEPKSKHPVGFY
jgi:hypothetical protein